MKKKRVFIVLGIIVALFFLMLIWRSMSDGTSIGQKGRGDRHYRNYHKIRRDD